jgi:NitT/TauT family transport system permease protein
MWKTLRPNRANLVIWQWLLLVLCFVLWYALTSPTLLPAFYFDDPNKAAFLFGEPQKVLVRIWQWFTSGEIYIHLWITLVETVLAFVLGTVLGLAVACGSRSRRSPARCSTRISRRPIRCRA